MRSERTPAARACCGWWLPGSAPRFDERRTGLDHMSFAVAGRADLQTWARWLDSLGVENSGVVDTGNPVPYSVVVFRDLDHIQLELIYMAG